MKPKDFYKTLENGRDFTKLTPTGISTNYDNVFAFAEAYYNARTQANGGDTGNDKCHIQNVSNSVLIDWSYDDEYGTTVTVKGIVDLWCMVEDIDHDEPYCVPLEFVQAIYDDSTDC